MHRYISNNVEIYNQTLLIFVHDLTLEEEQINWKILWAIVLIYVCIMYVYQNICIALCQCFIIGNMWLSACL